MTVGKQGERRRVWGFVPTPEFPLLGFPTVGLPILAIVSLAVLLGEVPGLSGQGANAADLRQITLYGGEKQSPYVCHTKDRPGQVTERIIEVFRRAGYDTHIECTAWNRAQALVKTDPDGVILNLARTPERENEYLWLLKTGEARYGLASLLHGYPSLEAALQEGSVAVVRGTPRAAELLAIGPESRVLQVNDPEQAARLLYGGRVVAWYETPGRIEREWAALSAATAAGVKTDPVFSPVHTIEGFVAAGQMFTDADTVRRAMQAVYQDMRESGRWAEIGRLYPVETP